MPHEPLRCRHIHAEGRQCGSPALRHEKLCYHHHSARRPVRSHLGPPTLPDPEDLAGVQRGLGELLRLVTRELIDDKQGKRLFAILAQAGTNLARVERARRAALEHGLRQRSLALAEARFAAQHPEAAAALKAGHPTDSEHSTETGCPAFGAASPRLRWASTVPEAPVTDPVDDPELGSIAPGPDPEPRPQPELAPPALRSPSAPPSR